MSRCIRFVINEGTPQEQAVAICASQYRKEKLKVMTWKTIDRKRASYIKYAKTEFYRALKAQANEYLDQVKQSGISAEYSISQAPIENAMYNVYSRVMRQFAQDTYSQMNRKAKKTEINWEEWVSRWFTNNTTDLIRGIDNYTQDGIRAIAERAIIEGWGIREFQNNLFDLYQISERRAELIGRTEIIRASNAGSLMGAQETGIPMMKYWLATRDNRTRGLNPKDVFDHYSMDEDKGIPLDQAFNVSGEQLQHPGDRAGSPGNTINCRCTLTYQVVDEIPEEVTQEAPAQEGQRYEMMASEVKDRKSFFNYMRTRGIDPKNTPKNILPDGYTEMAKQYEYLLDIFGEDPKTLMRIRGTNAFGKKGIAELELLRGEFWGSWDLRGAIKLNAERGRDRMTGQTYWQNASKPSEWNRGTSYMSTFLHETVHHYDYYYGVKKYNKGNLTFVNEKLADKFWDNSFMNQAMSHEIYDELLQKYGKDATLSNVKSLLGDYAYESLTLRKDPAEIVTLAFEKYYNNRNDEFTDFIVSRFIQKYKEI